MTTVKGQATSLEESRIKRALRKDAERIVAILLEALKDHPAIANIQILYWDDVLKMEKPEVVVENKDNK